MRRLVHLPLAVSTCVWGEALISLLCLHVSSFVHFHLSVSCLFGLFFSFFSRRRRCRFWNLFEIEMLKVESDMLSSIWDRILFRSRSSSFFVRMNAKSNVDCCNLWITEAKTVINFISQSLCVEQWVGRPFTRHSRATKSSSRHEYHCAPTLR